jgi:hypothetical protein
MAPVEKVGLSRQVGKSENEHLFLVIRRTRNVNMISSLFMNIETGREA